MRLLIMHAGQITGEAAQIAANIVVQKTGAEGILEFSACR
jgi:hypothetical protein